ncbi:MAG: LysM peptidoglycan-binding domain-containing protein [Elusimicrobia bacterium]|nr:LysM peptidoglycan-binding domain-containing protein [Elusimicrobiota bacterium]
MAAEASCPICDLRNLPDGAARCPQCDSDLACFRALDSIPEESAGKAPAREKSFGRAAMSLGIGLAAGIILLNIYGLERLELLIEDQQASLLRAINSLSLTIDRRSWAASKTDTAPAAQEFLNYRARAGDTLWRLADRFYGSGRLYPVIIEHNPHLGVYAFEPGSAVRILMDGAQAGKIYKRLRVERDGKILWSYRVSDLDTPDSIARKFYKAEDASAWVRGLDSKATLKPGGRILIPLPGSPP